MGVLDELRDQVQEVTENAGVTKARDAAEMAVNEARLRPRMLDLYRYFKEMIEHLQVLGLEIRTACELPGFGHLGELLQGDYRIWTDTPDDVSQFTFAYTCTSPERKECRLSVAAAQQLKKQLHAFNIKCTLSDAGSKQASVIMIPCIPVLFEVRGDFESTSIRVRVKNHRKMGAITYTYALDTFTDELKEELGKLVLKKTNRFETLSGGTVATENRAVLKQELARTERRRKAELGGSLSKFLWRVGEGGRRLIGKK